MIGSIKTHKNQQGKFTHGILLLQNNKKPKIFLKKKEMWQYLLLLSEKLDTHKKKLTLYSYDMQTTFYNLAQYNNNRLRYISHKPFIIQYKKKNTEKDLITFLDTKNIFPMNLKDIQKLITIPEIKLKYAQQYENITQIHKDIQHCITSLYSIIHIKDLLKKKKLRPKTLYTINQMSISYLMHELLKQPNDHIFKRTFEPELHHPRYAHKIHQSLRGGRVLPYQTGTYTNTTYLDVNSLYPYITTIMDFPDLSTETLHKTPLLKGNLKILQKIGVSQALLYNYSDEYGLLPVQTPHGNYYPQQGQHFIGTYTNEELQYALKNGYIIKHISWTITYESAPNPFITITPELYKQKLNANTPLERYFYKMMMNGSYGKLAQRNIKQHTIIDTPKNQSAYLSQGYQIIDYHGTNYIYKKKEYTHIYKKFYAPIITSLITALARIHMHKYLKLIPIKQLYYTDTDSILLNNNYANKLPISDKLGDFKIEHLQKTCTIHASKTYKIGTIQKMSGTKLGRQLMKEKVTRTTTHTIHTTKKPEQIGTKQKTIIYLKNIQEKHAKTQEHYQKQSLIIDTQTGNITEFIPFLPTTLKYN